MMNRTMPLRFRVTDHELLERRFDDQTGVYHTGSGDTHLLNEAAATGLALIRQRPRSMDEMVAALAEHFEEADEKALRARALSLTVHLERLDLVTSEEPSA